MIRKKDIHWIGTALDDLRAFPEDARRETGHQLNNIQSGLEADDWKPLSNLGLGINEIRIWVNAGTYRVIYVAKFEKAIYVLHCFQKKTRSLSKQDKDIIAARYKEIKKH